jgi:hypothetical protein
MEIQIFDYLLLNFLLAIIAYSVLIPTLKVHQTSGNFLLWSIRVTHLFITFSLCFYFLFPNLAAYDSYYLLFVSLMIIHWFIFNGECILDYWEKRILDKNYKIGTTPYQHIYTDILSPRLSIIHLLTMLNVIMVITRTTSISSIPLKILFVSIIVFVEIWFTRHHKTS